MFGFDIEKDELKEDTEFSGSIFEDIGYSKYLCPCCGSHLKESMGRLICLNACHLPIDWQKRFLKIVSGKTEKL